MEILAAAAVCKAYGSDRLGPIPPAELRYRLFALTVASDFPFTSASEADAAPAGLSLSLSPHPLLKDPPAPPLYTSALRDQDGASLGTLYRQPEGEILSFSRAGEFRFGSDRIDGYLPGGASDLAELRILGPVLSYWFECRGLPTLHGSAVSAGGRALVFLSRHGGGKSGLAAALVQAGCPLLTDDMVVLEEHDERWEVRPAYPEMRMWPDEASHFAGSPEELPRVQFDSEKRRVTVGDGGFGTFLDASAPLACIYLACRREETGGGVEIQPVPRSEALIELVRHSFSPRLVEAAGLQPGRLDRLARLVRSVPIRRLVYPTGFDRLPEIAEILMGS
jgi:hypothetical protein